MKQQARNNRQSQDKRPSSGQNTGTIPKLEELIARLYSQTPLIGWELRQLAVKALAKEGSSEAMYALADASIRSDDYRVRETALKALQKLAAKGKAEAQDALCQLAIEHDHPLAREIVFAAQYVPYDPNQQILFINILAISPDGQMLVSSSKDKTLRLWSLPDGTTVKILQGYTDDVRCLTISPDEQLLVSGNGDNTVRLWSLPDGVILQMLKGHSHSITCLAISPDGRVLVSGSNDNTIRLWSLPDGAPLHSLEGHIAGVKCLAIGPDGRLLASGSADHTIRLWSLPDGTALKTLRGHSAEVSCLVISPDGRVLVSGGADKAVRLWVLGKVDLSRLIVGYTSLKELRLLQERLQEEETAEAERTWLEFILVLIRWQRRFDIEVDEISRNIPVGKFDIEIE